MSACTLVPGLAGPGEEVGPQDVITLRYTHLGVVFQPDGSSTQVIGPDAVTVTRTSANDVVLYEYVLPLSADDRSAIEAEVNDYLQWITPDREELVHCTDSPSTGVGVSGSIEHSSSVQICGHEDAPPGSLVRVVNDVVARDAPPVAETRRHWSVVVEPEDPDAEAQTFEMRHGSYRAEGVPEDWAAAHKPEDGWVIDDSGELDDRVLPPLNRTLAELDIDCAAAEGTVVITDESEEIDYEVPMCPGTAVTELVSTLQEL
ncbi:MAG: hypothetical protein Q4G40_09380 [Brachybacterium sp.]|nr:hypothetical protein [Brachybacterium sp.]